MSGIHLPDLKPLLINVTRKGRWEAVPATIPPTPRDEMLLAEIKAAGGIDYTVPPGLYHFNVVPGPLGEVVTLVRVK